MAFVAFTLATLTAIVGTIGLVVPSWLATLAVAFHGPVGLAFAATVRVLLGASMFVAAPRSRAPLAFRLLGAATFALGLLTPLIGVTRFDALLDGWIALDPWLARIWSAGAAAGGGLVAYGIVPRDAR